MKKNKISIILPCFNVEDYVFRSYNSIVNQGYSNIELIYVNDCSTDSTVNKINEIKKIDKRVVLVNFSKNSGTFEARRQGYKKSSGDFIVFMDPDDEIVNGYFEKSLSLFEKSDLDIIFCKMEIRPRKFFSKEFSLPKYSAGDKIFINCIDKMKVIPKGNGGKIYKRSVVEAAYEKLEFVKKRFVFAEDVVFFFACLLSAMKIDSINEYFYIYHKNASSITRTDIADKLNKNLDQLDYAITSIKELIKNSSSRVVESSGDILVKSLHYDKLLIKRKISIIENKKYEYLSLSIMLLKNKIYFNNLIKTLIFIISLGFKKYS